VNEYRERKKKTNIEKDGEKIATLVVFTLILAESIVNSGRDCGYTIRKHRATKYIHDHKSILLGFRFGSQLTFADILFFDICM